MKKVIMACVMCGGIQAWSMELVTMTVIPQGSLKSSTVTLQLDEKVAPKHVSRIVELVESGFYQEMKFHRVVPDFVVQTGDPLANGTGGSGQNIAAEFSDAEFKAGSIGMARSQDVNSADSQFFICLSTKGCQHLTGEYTYLGQVSDEDLVLMQQVKMGDSMSLSYEYNT